MESKQIEVRRTDEVVLVGERRGQGRGPAVVFLHAGVADRRSWHGVFDELADDDLDLIAYDRRGYGDTAAGNPAEPFTHLDDLVALLDVEQVDRVHVVGNSMGGALALDLAATAPDRVAGVVLVAGGASGMTDEGEEISYEMDPATERLFGELERAEQAGDVERQARLLVHIWLDGPAQQEGRVDGPARELALDMNRRILRAAAPEDAGESGLDTWHGLGSIETPVIAAWGDLDIPADLYWYELIAERLPLATSRLLHGVAHLPSLEQPEAVAALVREAVGS